MRKIMLSTTVVTVLFFSCTNENKQMVEKQNADTTALKTSTTMNTFISIFEIPATDISRAINFYQTILDVKIEKLEMPEMQMGIFPYEGQMVTGVIIKADGYQPSDNGVTIYLNGGDDLQIILDKVDKNGGKILVPKSQHADESGYFALFLDPEGNKVGLHSPN